MLIDYVLIYMNINILGNITNHLIYHQSREHLGTKKRPIVLHTQFGFRDQMCYSFHMSQPTKSIFNGKFLQSKMHSCLGSLSKGKICPELYFSDASACSGRPTEVTEGMEASDSNYNKPFWTFHQFLGH